MILPITIMAAARSAAGQVHGNGGSPVHGRCGAGQAACGHPDAERAASPTAGPDAQADKDNDKDKEKGPQQQQERQSKNKSPGRMHQRPREISERQKRAWGFGQSVQEEASEPPPAENAGGGLCPPRPEQSSLEAAMAPPISLNEIE